MKLGILIALITLASCGSQAQNKKKMETKNNPLICDPKLGACEVPAALTTANTGQPVAGKKAVKVIYFTDPICSSCWGIEPQLRRLKLEYGTDVEFEYHMGGLLPDWSYNSGGISKPSDVAHHWDEVSQYYNMPIDGDVWLQDPLNSSYPPSIAFKAAQLQDAHKAIAFLRVLREMVFLQKKNITKWEYMEQAAVQVGLDAAKLKQDYEGRAKDLFQQDLKLAQAMGVRGFPSIFITDSTGKSEFVYGFKPYTAFEAALTKIYPLAVKTNYARDWKALFAKYPTLTCREFAELSDISFAEAEKVLDKLVEQKELTKLNTKNGALWVRR